MEHHDNKRKKFFMLNGAWCEWNQHFFWCLLKFCWCEFFIFYSQERAVFRKVFYLSWKVPKNSGSEKFLFFLTLSNSQQSFNVTHLQCHMKSKYETLDLWKCWVVYNNKKTVKTFELLTESFESSKIQFFVYKTIIKFKSI